MPICIKNAFLFSALHKYKRISGQKSDIGKITIFRNQKADNNIPGYSSIKEFQGEFYTGKSNSCWIRIDQEVQYYPLPHALTRTLDFLLTIDVYINKSHPKFSHICICLLYQNQCNNQKANKVYYRIKTTIMQKEKQSSYK